MAEKIDKEINSPKKYYSISKPIQNAYLNSAEYIDLYQQSIKNPTHFWSQQAKQLLTWYQPWQRVKEGDFNNLQIRWFAGAKLNPCYNCVDRHLENYGEKVALIWEGDEPYQSLKVTYKQLHEQVCRFANLLKSLEVTKGDRVCIYLPMIPEAIYAMLACARIGAIHSVVFAGFSAKSLRDRINDAGCKIVITADASTRGGKVIPLKQNADQALQDCPSVQKQIVIKHTNKDISWDKTRDVWYHDAIVNVASYCEPEVLDAEDPLFILYTSGSTGKPKGVLHSIAGYLLFVTLTYKYIFNYHPGEIYWCTADIGWITGHSYIVYGPLANAATILIYEGVPNYPSPARYWEMIDRYQVNIFYTAPTALRALRREGDDFVKKTKRTSLKILGSVGEPINPDVWEWYYSVVGNEQCPIVDTWWQTETGGIMISPFPGATKLKPGSAAWPVFGVIPEIVDDQGHIIEGAGEGSLVIAEPWPGVLRTIYADPERFAKTYFSQVPGKYFTGDGARRDTDGYLWITGRIDDVINVSGHRLGTAEIENALLKHKSVSEAAVVGIPDAIKGSSIYAYITLKAHTASPSEKLKEALRNTVKEEIGSIAKPEFIHWVSALPKTRSGKIMRRVLRKIAEGKTEDLGDISTLAEPEIIKKIIESK